MLRFTGSWLNRIPYDARYILEHWALNDGTDGALKSPYHDVIQYAETLEEEIVASLAIAMISVGYRLTALNGME